MPRLKADVLARSLEMMVAERTTSAAREKKLVGALNGLLAKMGYEVVELGGRVPGRRGRRRGRVSRRRQGRKPGRPARARTKGQGRSRKRGQGT